MGVDYSSICRYQSPSSTAADTYVVRVKVERERTERENEEKEGKKRVDSTRNVGTRRISIYRSGNGPVTYEQESHDEGSRI